MLKFIKHHMETIVGIEIFPVISFLIFFIFFLAMTIWILKMDKNKINEIAELPLNDNPDHDE